MNRKKFLILLIVLVGLSSIIKIGEAGTLSDYRMDTNLCTSSVAWGDIDNDGNFDLAMMGWDGTNRRCQIYKNGANNKLTLSQSLTGVRKGQLSFADYDRDGDLDLAITGEVTDYGTTKIYQNDGNGTFSDSGIEMIDVYNSALAWGDYDNDGDLDLVVIGFGMMGTGKIAKIYENYEKEGVVTFRDSGITDLTPVASGSVAWADYDNDGDLDLALAGDAAGLNVCKIYENGYRDDPDNPFSLRQNLTPVMNSSLAWGDYDNDGWLDIAICGQKSPEEYVCEIWKNNAGTFTKAQSLTPGVSNSSLAWGDYDNDGDLDLVVIGSETGEVPSSKIYKNSGESGGYTFSEDAGQSLENVDQGSLAWCDYDRDKDIDLVLTGYSGSVPVTKIYKNDGSPNTLPTPPDSSKFETIYDTTTKQLTIKWESGFDSETDPPTGLYYNFRIGSESGKDDLVAARYGSPLLGNFVSKSTTTVHTRTFSLYAKGYYWSVQAIDTGLGYSWSEEGTESGWAEEEGYYEDKFPPPPPETPTDEGEYTYDTTIRFSWTQKNLDPETAIFNYRLQVECQEDGTIKFDGNVGDVKSYKVSGCEYNKTYKARVMAQSGYGYGDWSAGWSDGIMVVRLLDISNNLIHPRKAKDNIAEIKYFIISPTKVNLKIYNLMGELVKSLVDNQYKATDDYVETWFGKNENGSTVASGIYLVHIEVKGANATEKICVVK